MTTNETTPADPANTDDTPLWQRACFHCGGDVTRTLRQVMPPSDPAVAPTTIDTYACIACGVKCAMPRRCVVCDVVLSRPRQRLYCGVKCNHRAAAARAKLAEAQAAAGRAEALAKEAEATYQKIKAMEAALPPATIASSYVAPTSTPAPLSLPRRIGKRIAAAWHTFCFYVVSLNTD